MTKDNLVKKFECIEISDIGKIRTRNEDFAGNFETRNGYAFVVCDGMGGHSGGLEASTITVNSIRFFLEKNYYQDPIDAIADSIIYANKQVYDESSNNRDLKGMGTTIAIILYRNDRIYYAHSGDSRIYYYSGNTGKLNRLTKDHSVIQDLLDKGMITEELAVNHPRKNELVNALGISERAVYTIGTEALVPNIEDIFMICTDGLTTLVNDQQISNELNQHIPAQEKAVKLIELANNNGGHDNITIQLIRFYLGVPSAQMPQLFELHDRKKYFIYSSFIFLFIVILLMVITIFNKNINESRKTMYINNQKIIEADYLQKDTNFLYIIKKGDSLNDISDRFNLSDSTLLSFNPHLKDELTVGQALKIPVKAIHKVKSGENLSIIESIYHIRVELIMKANEINSTELISGQDLYIPSTREKK
jgi:PPM family protein phosphatase